MLRFFDNILEKSSKGLIVIILKGASDSFLDILNWNEYASSCKTKRQTDARELKSLTSYWQLQLKNMKRKWTVVLLKRLLLENLFFLPVYPIYLQVIFHPLGCDLYLKGRGFCFNVNVKMTSVKRICTSFLTTRFFKTKCWRK